MTLRALLCLLAARQAAAAPWGACASPSFADPSLPAAAPPAWAAPPPAGVSVPAPRPPLVLRTNASEVVTLPSQALPSDAELAARTGCPHDAAGLRPWHDPVTWPGGVVPAAGADVTVPVGAPVLLSSCSLSPSDVLNSLTVPAGATLVLSDAAIALAARAINVAGALLGGGVACRLRAAVNITLVGARPGGSLAAQRLAVTAPPANAKGILVSGTGTLELHGARFAPTWTRLAAPAAPGDAWIFLQDRVNWDVGATVVVTTTALKDARDYSESEERVVAAVYAVPAGGGVVTALRLDAPLAHSHYAGSEYQAEVGLLSRRLVVAGSLGDSPPLDAAPVSCPAPGFSSTPCGDTFLTGYGGHVMVMGAAATGRVSGVLFERMGQTNTLGRYAMHYHLVGDGGARSYVQDSAFWRSYFRCVSVHGTNGARLSRNVAHDVVGHCYYLEDGVEVGNTLEFNLGSLVHAVGAPPTTADSSGQNMPTYSAGDMLLVPADITAAPFYITNANNTFVGNAASGGWTGFAFINLPTPLGVSRAAYPGYVPSDAPTLVFEGNVAHSSGYWWTSSACIYVGGWLAYDANGTQTYNPGRSNARGGLVELNNTKVFACNVGMLNWGWAPRVNGMEAHDVTRAATIFGDASVTRLLMNCRTPNAAPRQPTGSQWLDATFANWDAAAFQWYDTGQRHILTDVTFRNCYADPAVPWRTVWAWQLLTHSDQYLPSFMEVTRNVTYENMSGAVPQRISVTVNGTHPTVSHRLQNWLDADGSATGRGVPTIIGSARSGDWWRLDSTGCTQWDAWTMVGCDARGARRVGAVSLRYDAALQGGVGSALCFNGGTPDSAVSCPDVGTVYHVGGDPARGMRFTPNTLLTGALNGFGWVVAFDQGSPAALRLVSPQMRPDDVLMVVLPYPAGTTFNVSQSVDYVLDGSPCASWCTPDWCHCTWPFAPAASPEAVRLGRGDGYFFSGNATHAGHLYVRVTPQYSWAVATGPGGTWDIPTAANGGGSFAFGGLSIPPYNYGSTLVIAASNCAPSTAAGLSPPASFCAVDPTQPPPPPPCATGAVVAYDACATPSASATATGSPTASRTPTASLSVGATPSTTATAAPTPTATPTASGTPVRAAAVVRVQSPPGGGQCLNFVELLAFDVGNRLVSAAAAGGVAVQTTTYCGTAATCNVAAFGIDLLADPTAAGASQAFVNTGCAAGNSDFWQVTLARPAAVSTVHFVNRLGGYNARVTQPSPAQVQLLAPDGSLVGSAPITGAGTVSTLTFVAAVAAPTPDPALPAQRDAVVRARSTRFVRLDAAPGQCLAFRELFVLDDALTNVALMKPTTASATAAGSSAAMGVDGVVDYDAYDPASGRCAGNVVSTTACDGSGWWTVDLGGVYNVTAVIAWNCAPLPLCATSACAVAGALAGATLTLLDFAGTGVVGAATLAGAGVETLRFPASPSGTPSPTPSATASRSATGSPSGTLTPSGTPTAAASPSLTGSVAPTPSVTAAATRSGTPAPTPSASAAATQSRSAAQTPSATAAMTASATAAVTPSLSAVRTPTPTRTRTATPSAARTHTASASASASGSASASASEQQSPSLTPAASPSSPATPTPSPSSTASLSSAPTGSMAASGTATALPTESPATTPTTTSAPAGTPSHSPTASRSPSRLPSLLRTPPGTKSSSKSAPATRSGTSTATRSRTPTKSSTQSRSMTRTATRSRLPSATASASKKVRAVLARPTGAATA